MATLFVLLNYIFAGFSNGIKGIACLNDHSDKISECTDMLGDMAKQDNSPNICCSAIKSETCVRSIAKVYCKSDAMDALDSILSNTRDVACKDSSDNMWTCLDTVWQVVIGVVAVLVALAVIACIARVCRCC